MNVVEALGSLSDRITRRLVHSLGKSEQTDSLEVRMGVVRSAQLEAIISTSRPMMLANLANAVALILVGLHVGDLAPLTILWALVLAAYAVVGWRRAQQYENGPRRETAGLRAPGKITLSAVILGVLWCYPLVFVLPTGSAVEIGFVSALTAGMVAGGALALYPVPLAAMLYAAMLWITAFGVIFFSGVLPALPFAIVTAAFSYVVLHAVLRHAGMFLSELVEKLQAQRQSDIANLLLHSYQGAGGHYLWRCDASMRMATDPAPLRRMLQLAEGASPKANLVELLNAVDARVVTSSGLVPFPLCLEGLMAARRHFNVKLRLGIDRTFEFVGRPEAPKDNVSGGFHGYLKDVTQETRSADKITRLASRDALTGLWNYREFQARGSAMFQAGHAEGCCFAFLFVDADNLKSVNDNFGHAVGDNLITEIATRLTAHLPKGSLVARKGGDEFVALTPCAGAACIDEWSEDVLGKLCGDFDRDGLKHAISCCIGISHSAGRVTDLGELELQADRALYHAKSNGKQQVRLYDEEIGQKLHRTRVLERDLKPALMAGELYLDFQPIFDAVTLKALGTEALLRWDHPVFGAVPAEEIVARARSESLNIKLLEHVLATAIAGAKTLPFKGFLSINVNPADLNCAYIGERIVALLGRHDFTPARLWLEVTESEVLRNSADATKNLDTLRAAGIKIAIDDFGAGYSSLSRLAAMPADVLKIDRELVRQCDTQEGQKVILNALRTLAQIHGLIIVAEGVETARELQTLIECDVDMLQGFALAKPMPPDQIATLVCADTLQVPSAKQLQVAV